MAFTYYFIINKDPATVFTNYNFLSRLDIELSLGRDLVKTAAAGITLNGYHSQTVPCI